MLLTIAGEPGQGKSEIVRHLLPLRPRLGILVSVAGGIRVPDGMQRMECILPFSPKGAEAIARAALQLHAGELLVVDDAESFLDPSMSRRNAFRALMQYRRNLAIDVWLCVKDPLDLPRQIRTNTDLWIVHPGGDASSMTWLRKQGLPVTREEQSRALALQVALVPPHVFYVGRRGVKWQKIDARRSGCSCVLCESSPAIKDGDTIPLANWSPAV